jgi:cellulase/cellobiase CelA1
VGLLIGSNVPKAMERLDVIPGVNNGPFAVTTLLGWVMNRPWGIQSSSRTIIYSTFVSVDCIDVKPSLEEHILHQFD